MAKGVAIILMVLAHTNFSKYGVGFISMFHMPLFFFFSGFCFKEVYLQDFVLYAKKRLNGAYKPFVVYSILFLLLHNFFFHIHVYDDVFGFQDKTSYVITCWDTIKRAAVIVFTMNETEQLLGGYWFLHSYFIAAFITYLFIYIASLVSQRKVLWLFGAGSLLCCWLMLLFHVRVPFYIDAKDILAAFFMLVGYKYKKSNWQLENYPCVVIPTCFGIVLAGVFLGGGSMLTLTAKNLLYYVPAALAGILFVFSLCKSLKNFRVVSVPLSFTGKRTLGILTWHFLCFKIVSIVIVHIYNLPINQIAEFPVITEYVHHGWWLLYLVVGVCLPILIDGGLSITSLKVRSIFSNISRGTDSTNKGDSKI